ncbi:MAG TPA: ABC transporter permease [Candidatus Acidoferrum sp.]|nr:ABC transporter permease [Candidatus Acidoferrum sp.]
MGNLLQDLRYGIRVLVKSPGFTAVAVLSLTLGIGANTTIFTMAKAIFLKTIPVNDPATLMSLFSTAQSKGGPVQEFLPTPYPNARDYREKNDVFSGVAIAIPTGADLTVRGKKVQVFCEVVNENFFDVLGVQPAHGRTFSAEEAKNPTPVAVISYAFWNRELGADPNVVGKTIQINQQDFAVIGIMPNYFHDLGVLGSPDVWTPMLMHDQVLTGLSKDWFEQRAFRLTSVVARLKPGVTVAQARDSIHRLGLELEREYPKDNGGRNEMVVPISQTAIPPQLRSVYVRAGSLMMLIVGLVLLIACANVANLLLARATQRHREIGVRLAMGASRFRLIQQLLTESLMMALLAGGLGILFAYWGKSLMKSLLPPGLQQRLDFSLDGRVLLYTLVLAIVATILFGLMPAVEASKGDRLAALKDRTGNPTGSARWYGLRGVLVMLQVALSLVALAGAGLFIHSLRNAQEMDPGFEVKHELVMFMNLGAEHYDQARAEQFYKDVVERLRGISTVQDASISDTFPFSGGLARTTFTDGVDITDPRNGKLTPVVAVEPGYFSAAGVAMLQGRDFSEHDDLQGAMAGIVNRAAADQMWPGQDPIGKHIHFLGETWDIAIVGEVATVKYQTMGEPPQPIVYLPLKQHYSAQVVLYVKAKGDPEKAIPSVRSTVQVLGPTVPLLNVQTVPQVLVQSLTAPRLGAELLGGFGLLALILAAIGTYGVMSYSVSQRTQEVGIRMSLGAQPRDVLRLILSNGMAMVCAGVVAGLVFSTLLAKSINSLLYGIGVFDAPSFLITSALLMLVALAACYLPARRAMRVDPIIALRYE